MATKRLEWFPCFPSKWLGALSRMRPDEGYLYLIVCFRIYEVGGPCRDSLDNLTRLSGMNRRRVSNALDLLFRSGKLVREGDGIMNPVAAEVMADSMALHEERVRAGQVGGKRSAEKRKEKQGPSASAATAKPKQSRTQEQEHKQDSLFSNENSAVERDDAHAAAMKDPPLDPVADYYRRGKEVLGPSAGGMLTQLLKARGGNVALARANIETASTRGDARQYVAAMVKNNGNGGSRNEADRGIHSIKTIHGLRGEILRREARAAAGEAAGGGQSAYGRGDSKVGVVDLETSEWAPAAQA